MSHCRVQPPPARAATWQAGDDFHSFSATECCWQSDLVWSRGFPKINTSLSNDLKDTLKLARVRGITVPRDGSCRYESAALIYKCSYACSCTHTGRNTQLQCSQHTSAFLKAFSRASVNNEGWNRRWTKHVVLFWRLKVSEFLNPRHFFKMMCSYLQSLH